MALRGVVLPPKKTERPEARTESFAWYGWSRYETVSRTTPGESKVLIYRYTTLVWF